MWPIPLDWVWHWCRHSRFFLWILDQAFYSIPLQYASHQVPRYLRWNKRQGTQFYIQRNFRDNFFYGKIKPTSTLISKCYCTCLDWPGINKFKILTMVFMIWEIDTSGPPRWWCVQHNNLLLTLSPPNYSIWIFTHLKLCFADAIHNFKWVKIIQIWQNGGRCFQILLIDVTFYL